MAKKHPAYQQFIEGDKPADPTPRAIAADVAENLHPHLRYTQTHLLDAAYPCVLLVNDGKACLSFRGARRKDEESNSGDCAVLARGTAAALREKYKDHGVPISVTVGNDTVHFPKGTHVFVLAGEGEERWLIDPSLGVFRPFQGSGYTINERPEPAVNEVFYELNRDSQGNNTTDTLLQEGHSIPLYSFNRNGRMCVVSVAFSMYGGRSRSNVALTFGYTDARGSSKGCYSNDLSCFEEMIPEKDVRDLTEQFRRSVITRLYEGIAPSEMSLGDKILLHTTKEEAEMVAELEASVSAQVRGKEVMPTAQQLKHFWVNFGRGVSFIEEQCPEELKLKDFAIVPQDQPSEGRDATTLNIPADLIYEIAKEETFSLDVIPRVLRLPLKMPVSVYTAHGAILLGVLFAIQGLQGGIEANWRLMSAAIERFEIPGFRKKIFFTTAVQSYSLGFQVGRLFREYFENGRVVRGNFKGHWWGV